MTPAADTSSSSPAAPVHVPVMLREVLATLRPRDGGVYVDGTFGAGGYTRAVLDSADCKVYAIDRDPEAIARARVVERDYPGRFVPLHGCFGDMAALLKTAGVDRVDGIVLDLGVSSIQLSTPARGFSFLHDGPLDMRMGASGESARDFVNTASEKTIADVIYKYGEEKAARRVAARIVAARPLETTFDLVRAVESALGPPRGDRIHPATRTFQAIRIYINDEMGEIDRALEAAQNLLVPGGRLVVVSFHSLEDWRVKTYFREKSGRAPAASRHAPLARDAVPALYDVESPRGLTPQEDEVAQNPRARSARLRFGIRTEALLPPTHGAAHA